jgi:hypothetical protein
MSSNVNRCVKKWRKINRNRRGRCGRDIKLERRKKTEEISILSCIYKVLEHLRY